MCCCRELPDLGAQFDLGAPFLRAHGQRALLYAAPRPSGSVPVTREAGLVLAKASMVAFIDL